ncbi:MAG TPA: methylated-DNA--[protein]-cysteine S-methyltransferase [Negativicutes bacterium]|nr:methylated-DNA--[protein]-cysteine S-methyltransferase [Negativicutes bacterium]
MTRKLSFLPIKRGVLAAVWSEQGLYELTFPYPTAREAQGHLTTTGLMVGDLDAQQQRWQQTLLAELEAYFAGKPIAFTVPVDWSGYTEFRLQALQFTAAIPFGQVATYGGVAMSVGRAGAARAVGGAMHANRTPIVVPCHRVVGSDGSLTGFGGGLTLKQELLGLEKK